LYIVPVNRPKVLIIDDEPMFSSALELALGENYEVHLRETAPSCDEVRDIAPGLIMLDWTLPGMSGEDALNLYLSADGTKEIPIVLMSGRNDLRQTNPEATNKSHGFLAKPFTFEALHRTVEQALKVAP